MVKLKVEPKKSGKFYVTTDADRVLDVLGFKFELVKGEGRKEITAEQAKELKKKYPYLDIEEL